MNPGSKCLFALLCAAFSLHCASPRDEGITEVDASDDAPARSPAVEAGGPPGPLDAGHAPPSADGAAPTADPDAGAMDGRDLDASPPPTPPAPPIPPAPPPTDPPSRLVSVTSLADFGYVAVSADAIYATGLFGLFTRTHDFGGVTAAGAGAQDFYVARYDLEGNLQWVKTTGNAGYDYGSGIALARDGTVVVSGCYRKTLDLEGMTLPDMGGGENENGFVAWYSPSGSLLRVSSRTGCGGVQFDASGNLLATSYSLNQSSLVSFAPDGQVNWIADDKFSSGSIAIQADGSFFVGAQLNPSLQVVLRDGRQQTLISKGSLDIAVLKYTRDGKVVWATGFGSEGFDFANIAADAADVYVSGSFEGASLEVGGQSRPRAAKVTAFAVKLAGSDGRLQWVQSYRSTDNLIMGSPAVDARGRLVLGVSFSTGSGSIDLGLGDASGTGVAGFLDTRTGKPILVISTVSGVDSFALSPGGDLYIGGRRLLRLTP